MRLPLLFLVFALPSAAESSNAFEMLEHDGPVAVLRLTTVQPDGTATGDVIAPGTSGLPEHLTVIQQGPLRHTFTEGMTIVAALRKVSVGWVYVPKGPSPTEARRSTGRALARFLSRAREAHTRPPTQQFDVWLSALDHPSEVARTLGFGRLMAHRDTLHPLLEPERVNRLGHLLTAPDTDPSVCELVLRLMVAYANDAVVRWVDTHWAMLRSDRLRLQAVGVFQRVKSPTADAALDRCAREARGAAQKRCVRIQLRKHSDGR